MKTAKLILIKPENLHVILYFWFLVESSIITRTLRHINVLSKRVKPLFELDVTHGIQNLTTLSETSQKSTKRNFIGQVL